MKPLVLTLSFCTLLNLPAVAQFSTSPAQASWQVKELFAVEGGPTGQPPIDPIWSPDAARVTFVATDGQQGSAGDLIQVDAVTGLASVLLTREKLSNLMAGPVSEKDKDHHSRYSMSNYVWGPDSRHVLFDSAGQLWLFDLRNGTGIQMASTGTGSGDDPKFSPDGRFISYIRDHNLYLRVLHGGSEVPLTATHQPTLLNGEVDWVYQEELDVRSNYFWSPDSHQIAYLQMNEDTVPQYPILDWIPARTTTDLQRYPQPGDSNPDVRVGVVAPNGGKTSWLKIPVEGRNDYIPRFGWLDNKTVWVELLKRDQKHVDLYFAEPQTGSVRRVFEDSDDKFLDDAYDIFFLDTPRFVRTSWRDGHNHIYLYSYDRGNPLAGDVKLEKQLTAGDFDVSEISGMDQARQAVYFLSNEGDPREEQIWSVQLNGEQKHRLSTTAGTHKPSFAPDGAHYLDTSSSSLQPPTARLCDIQGKCSTVWKSQPLSGHSLVLPTPLEGKASDGTRLLAELSLPPGAAATATIPLIVNPYGGPHAQTIRNAWPGGSGLFDQILLQHGFAVLHVDNRGMGGRGRTFAQAAYHNFGAVQFEDQMAVVDQVLKLFPQLDSNRLGWWGWSWGGTFTLYAMTHSDRFQAGVAVAPVTSWRLYDSIYTERYLGQPPENEDGYKADSVAESAAKLKGHLLLVQGTGDDNVHLQNSIQFLQGLIDADIPYDLQLYPRKTHSIAGREARTHLFERILFHFEHYLKHPAAE